MRFIVALAALTAASLAACSARQQAPDATQAAVPPPPDATMDAGIVDATVDATPAPLTIASDRTAVELDELARRQFAGAVATTLADAGATGWAHAVVVDGRVIGRWAAGRTAEGAASDTTSPRPLGRVTRVLTGLLAADLIEEGHFTWASPLYHLRPDWVTTGTPPTVGDMTCACFGVGALTGTPPARPREALSLLERRITAGDALEALPTPLMVAAGGYVVARAAPSVPLDPGAAYVDQLFRRVTRPLAMHGTGIGSPESPGVVPVLAPDGGAWGPVDDGATLTIALLEGGLTPRGGRIVEDAAIDALLEVYDGERGPATRGGLRVETRGDLALRVIGGPTRRGHTRMVLAPAGRIGWFVRVEGAAPAVAPALERLTDQLLELRYGLADRPPIPGSPTLSPVPRTSTR